MRPADVNDDLRRIANHEDFAIRSSEVVDSWTSAGASVDVVESILRFMEEHRSIDFGMPGPLVHFVESFYGHGYEERLLESLERVPTLHTVWMLNRLINGASDPSTYERFSAAMARARRNPLTDERTAQRINHFLQRNREEG
jgi:hypothetical protein